MIQNRDEIQSRLDELYAKSGAAKLDGEAFDYGSITALENELRQIDAAESERVRRQREQDAKDAAASRAHKVKQISALETDRQKAWADVEAATRSLAEAIGRVVRSSESERDLWVTKEVPTPIGFHEVKRRIRGRVGEILHSAKCGFEVPGASGLFNQAPRQDWREEERKAMAQSINALEEKN